MAIDLATNQRVALKIMNDQETQLSKYKQYEPRMLKSFLN